MYFKKTDVMLTVGALSRNAVSYKSFSYSRGLIHTFMRAANEFL